MPKFQRQGTFAPQEFDVLHAIDERFEELEQTKALASLVPQLHERLYAVEQMLRRMRSPLEHSPLLPKEVMEVKEMQEVKRANRADEIHEINPNENEVPNKQPKEAEGLVGVSLPVSEDSPKANDKNNVSRKISDISRSKLHVMDETTLNTQTVEYYTFGESTWDLVIFIGTGALGPFGSFQTFLLAVVNVLMQVVFVAIASYNFTTPEVGADSIVDVQRWRRSSGHSFDEYSEVAKESLVHRVCKMDMSLESSGIQVALRENISKYLKSDAPGLEGWFTGQILCIVALICWYLMVAKEVSHALALHRGIAAMPRGTTKLDTRENPFTQATHYRVRAVSMPRKICSGILLLYRLVAAGLLLWVGTTFLVYTVSVTELILNAVALGIILDIDDLLFDALATTPGRHLVHQLDPLHMPSLPRLRGADAKSVFMSLFIPSLVILVYANMLAPMVSTLEAVQTAMCGGNQDFVWSMDKRRLVQFAPTFGGGWQEEEESIKTAAIEEAERIGYDLSINATRFGLWNNDVSVLGDLALVYLETMIVDNNPNCGDIGNNEPELNYLRYLLGNASIESCADAKPYCNSMTKMPEYGVDDGKGYAARMLCSETCGCGRPGGDHVLVQGCPYGIVDGQGLPCQRSQAFASFRARSLCVEEDPETLRQNPAWIKWVDTIRAYSRSPGAFSGKAEAAILAQAMWDYGCNFGFNVTAENVTWGNCFNWNTDLGWPFKTLENFCPFTCGCGPEHSALTGCPKPFNIMDCQSFAWSYRCITYRKQHFCDGFSRNVYGRLTLQVPTTTRSYDFQNEIKATLQAMLAHFAGHSTPTEAIHLDNLWANPLVDGNFDGPGQIQALWYLFLVEPHMQEASIAAALRATPLTKLQDFLDANSTTNTPNLTAQLMTVFFVTNSTVRSGESGGTGGGVSAGGSGATTSAPDALRRLSPEGGQMQRAPQGGRKH